MWERDNQKIRPRTTNKQKKKNKTTIKKETWKFKMTADIFLSL
jgi:hypothetical protein